MIFVPMGLLGILIGGFTAHKRNGSTADMLQYAAVYGIAFAIMGIVLTIVLDRAGFFS